MTRLMVGMHDSVLSLESSNTGWNSRESLKGTQPQSIAFDPLNSGRVYVLLLETAYGDLMIMVRPGVTLERMSFPVHMLCLLQLVH